jgi:hypothetical protein
VLRKLFSSEEPLTPDPSPRSGARGDREKERKRGERGEVWWFARVPTTAAKADRLIRFPLQLTAYSCILNA